MYKFLCLLVFSLCLSGTLHAQQVLLKQDVDSTDFKDRKFGPNGKNYLHTWVAFGVALGPDDQRLPVIYGRSTGYDVGALYKRRLSGLLSAGLTAQLAYTSFLLKQRPGYGITDSLFWDKDASHKKERLEFSGIGLGAFFRINFDPHRGDYIGHYLDLGARSYLNLSLDYTALDNRAQGIRVRSHFSRLPYANPLENYVYAKLGFNWLGLCLQYRLNDMFKAKYDLPGLPPYLLQLEVSFLN